jgi:uncharacterized protein (PEP-CTERM system associated)
VWPACRPLSQATATRRVERSGRTGRSVRACLVLAIASLSAAAIAQEAELAVPAAAPHRQWFFQPTVRLLETFSDNATFGITPQKSSDLLSLFEPSFVLAGRTADFTVNGWYSVELLDYARGSQSNSISPSGNLDAKYAVVPQHFFLDGSAASWRVVDTPFGANPTVTPGLGSSSLTRVRLSPFFQSEPSATLRYLIRADTEWVHEQSLTNAPPNAVAMRQLVEVERRPVPLGLMLAADREATRFQSASQGQLTDEHVRATARYAIESTLTVGVRGGYAHNNFAATEGDRNAPIAGAELLWALAEDTRLSGYGEHRDFGAAWQASFYHRDRLLAWDLTSSRSVTTAPQSILEPSTFGSFSTLLDEVYAARYHDPTERLRAVSDALANAGLPQNIGLPIAVYMAVPIRFTAHQLSVTALRPRNLAVVSVYDNRNETLPVLPGLVSASTLTNAFSYNATGATLSDTYRLRPLSALTARFDWSRAHGFNTDSGQTATQYTGQLQWVQQLSRNLYALVGSRFQKLNSSTLGREHESAILAGAAYRFR